MGRWGSVWDTRGMTSPSFLKAILITLVGTWRPHSLHSPIIYAGLTFGTMWEDSLREPWIWHRPVGSGTCSRHNFAFHPSFLLILNFATPTEIVVTTWGHTIRKCLRSIRAPEICVNLRFGTMWGDGEVFGTLRAWLCLPSLRRS